MFQDLIKKRRSIRSYTGEKVSKEDLECLLEAGLSAPSAKNRKPVEYIVIEDEKMLDHLGKFKKGTAAFIGKAPLAIAILVDKEAAQVTYVQDASIAATFIQLQATDLGLGSCWANVLGSTDPEGRPGEVYIREALEVPEKYSIQAIIAIGHIDKFPKDLPPFDRKAKIHYEKY